MEVSYRKTAIQFLRLKYIFLNTLPLSSKSPACSPVAGEDIATYFGLSDNSTACTDLTPGSEKIYLQAVTGNICETSRYIARQYHISPAAFSCLDILTNDGNMIYRSVSL